MRVLLSYMNVHGSDTFCSGDGCNISAHAEVSNTESGPEHQATANSNAIVLCLFSTPRQRRMQHRLVLMSRSMVTHLLAKTLLFSHRRPMCTFTICVLARLSDARSDRIFVIDR